VALLDDIRGKIAARQYFAPETVAHIHALVEGRKAPKKVIETRVYEYA
jgi:hypothetical protein